MKKYYTLVLLVFLLIFYSCIEHEVIPPPVKEVELKCLFSASIDTIDYKLEEDKEGFHCKAEQAKEVLPAPMPSTVIYYSSMLSNQKLDKIQVKIGKALFDNQSTSDPTIETFEAFFIDNYNPDFKKDGDNGVEVIFTNSQGVKWRSNPHSTNNQNFEFSTLSLKSDENGDYMTFVADFSCFLYNYENEDNPDFDEPVDSIYVLNARYTNYFRRKNPS